MVILALSMGRACRLIAVLLVALAMPATAAAEAPQIYVGSGAGYSVAFKVEGSKVYVLGLDATIYCEVLEPREASEPALTGFFAAPKLMRQKGAGLIATEGDTYPFGPRPVRVGAKFEGEKLVGSFEYRAGEESGHCQSGGYFGTPPSVPFEAVRYVPVDGSVPVPPFASAASAVYYGTKGPLETFFSVFGSALGLRGTVASDCLAAKKQRAAGHGPLSSAVLITRLADGGSFDKKILANGPHGLASIKETITLTGSVGDASLTGTYLDRIRTRLSHRRKRVCHTGPLPFRAVRYLPATP
jgi:hypothetical protein